MDAQDKQSLVEKIFSSVADKYDLMNDLMSFGLHRAWKNKFVKMLTLSKDSKVLDSASGTGDIGYRILSKYPHVNITLCDKNIDMLIQGKNKFINANILTANFVCADSENLPFINDYFDCYTIAFGIRNVSNIKKALTEAHRVLKPGGRFLCLEFGHVEHNCLSAIYDLYSFKVIPFIGQTITKNREAYEYLVNSIRQFPFKEEFIILMHEVAFKEIKCISLSGSTVNIYSGTKC